MLVDLGWNGCAVVQRENATEPQLDRRELQHRDVKCHLVQRRALQPGPAARGGGRDATAQLTLPAQPSCVTWTRAATLQLRSALSCVIPIGILHNYKPE